jgi:hypothetical protein
MFKSWWAAGGGCDLGGTGKGPNAISQSVLVMRFGITEIYLFL